MKRIALISALMLAHVAPAASADVLQGVSPDPLGELNALYGKICRWTEDEAIPSEIIDLTHDGIDDYLVTYDVPCRGQAGAFAGTAGMARQIWVSAGDDTWVRILDVNSRALRLETRDGHEFIILQHRGDYCMTADAAPCFLTLEFTENQLIWADAQYQHPSMDARLRLLEAEQEENSND